MHLPLYHKVRASKATNKVEGVVVIFLSKASSQQTIQPEARFSHNQALLTVTSTQIKKLASQMLCVGGT